MTYNSAIFQAPTNDTNNNTASTQPQHPPNPLEVFAPNGDDSMDSGHGSETPQPKTIHEEDMGDVTPTPQVGDFLVVEGPLGKNLKFWINFQMDTEDNNNTLPFDHNVPLSDVDECKSAAARRRWLVRKFFTKKKKL